MLVRFKTVDMDALPNGVAFVNGAHVSLVHQLDTTTALLSVIVMKTGCRVLVAEGVDQVACMLAYGRRDSR